MDTDTFYEDPEKTKNKEAWWNTTDFCSLFSKRLIKNLLLHPIKSSFEAGILHLGGLREEEHQFEASV